jgi:hypothetical protein
MDPRLREDDKASYIITSPPEASVHTPPAPSPLLITHPRPLFHKEREKRGFKVSLILSNPWRFFNVKS